MYKSLKVLPECHKRIVELSKKEGRTISKTIEILIENYSKGEDKKNG